MFNKNILGLNTAARGSPVGDVHELRSHNNHHSDIGLLVYLLGDIPTTGRKLVVFTSLKTLCYFLPPNSFVVFIIFTLLLLLVWQILKFIEPYYVY